MSPTVSAIIPTYNRAGLLPAALESVFAQTVPVNEVIVVDDGSTDNTAEVLASYGTSVRYLRQENAGPGAARNRGMREARCDYLAFLDSDDLWPSEKNALQLDLLQTHPEVDFVFGDMASFCSENDASEAEIKNPELHRYFITHSSNLKALFECLVVENVIPTGSVMYRKSCVDRVGFFDQQLRWAEDLEYWLRVSLRCRCAFVNAILLKRRRHPGNLINEWAECNQGHTRVLAQALHSSPGISPRARRMVLEKLARLYYDLGSYYLKRRAFATSYSYLRMGGPRYPFDLKRLVKIAVSSLLRHHG